MEYLGFISLMLAITAGAILMAKGAIMLVNRTSLALQQSQLDVAHPVPWTQV